MSGIVIKLFLSELVVFLLPFFVFGLAFIRITSFPFVIHKTEEIDKTRYLKSFIDLFGAVQEHDLRLLANLLLGEEKSFSSML